MPHMVRHGVHVHCPKPHCNCTKNYCPDPPGSLRCLVHRVSNRKDVINRTSAGFVKTVWQWYSRSRGCGVWLGCCTGKIWEESVNGVTHYFCRLKHFDAQIARGAITLLKAF